MKSEQLINASIEEVWEYFSQPKNLDNLTPDNMGFKITSGTAARMYAGQIMSYQIEVFPKVKHSWITEIKHVTDKKMFVDEQRFGPYAMWHHEHHFEALSPTQVQMNDIVSYKLPFGILGRWLAGKMIRQRVVEIFEYREKKVNMIFA